MMTQRRPSGLDARGARLVAGLAAFPLALAFAAGPAPTQEPKAEEPAGAPAAVLRGRVTGEANAPLAGARVRVAIPATDMRFVGAGPLPLVGEPNPGRRLLEARTDDHGDYRLELPGIRTPTTVSIDVLKPGYRRLVGTLMAGGDARTVEVQPGATEEANLALEPARYFKGVVVDGRGRPVPSAQVGAYFQFDQGTGGVELTSSGADGTFELFNYFVEPKAFRGEAGRAVVHFTHPDHVPFQFEILDDVEPARRESLRITLETGHRLAGLVLDEAGKPVARATVKAMLDDGDGRKATVTGPDGKFALAGLKTGPTTLTALGTDVKHRARLSMAVDGDKPGLEVRLRAVALPVDLKTYDVLGLKLADVDPAVKAVYDLYFGTGAVILDPGRDSARLDVGPLAEGYSFWEVGDDTRVNGVREFVDAILAETAGRDADRHSVRVVFSFTSPEGDGNNTQYLKLTRADVAGLKELSARLKAGGR